MSASRRVAVRFDDQVWNEAIRGFSGQALECALAARRSLDERGINLAELRPCLAEGPDGTQLSGCAKLYLPVKDAPPSQRPFAFVLQLAREREGLTWVFVAFGLRHPPAGVRSAYERAHRQLHGRFPG